MGKTCAECKFIAIDYAKQPCRKCLDSDVPHLPEWRKMNPNPELDALVKEINELLPWDGKDKATRYDRHCNSWEKSPNFDRFRGRVRLLLAPLVERKG
jgi:hypothetical protein